MIRPALFINALRSAINIMRRGLFITAIALFPFAAQNASAQQSRLKPSPKPLPQPTPSRGGAITGRVITDDGQPLATAQVTVNPAVLNIADASRPLVSIDAQGNFHTSHLAPGGYSVSASVPGYLRTSISPGSGEYGRYQPGDSITITMKKGGAITGQVTDEHGQPVVGINVRLVIKRYEETGWSIGGGETDDRGMYRIYGLPSGTYLVAVNDHPFQTSLPSPYDRLAPTYYPSSTYETAREVNVHLGEEVSGIDIRFRGERGYTISGAVAGLGALVPGTYNSLEITLTRPNSTELVASYRPSRNSSGFAFNGLPDGEYILKAMHEFGGGYGAAAQPRTVKVHGADVTGLEIPLLPLASISGRIVVEALPPARRRGACTAAHITSQPNTRAWAQLDEQGGTLSDRPYVSFSGVSTGIPNERGEFTIYKVSPGHFRIVAPSANQPWYIRSITLPGAGKSIQNVARDGLTFTLGERLSGLTITVAEGAATLRGKVVADNEGSRLPPRLQVYAVPMERARADDVLRYAQTYVDLTGKFFFNDLAPGKYWLLLRATPEGVSLARPIIWDSDERAKLRREAEAANVVIDLPPCQRVNDYLLRYTPPSNK